MWILIVILANIAPDSGAASTITTQEFQSQQSCEAARSFVQSTLGPDAQKMQAVMQNALQSGTLQGPRAIVFKTECTKK